MGSVFRQRPVSVKDRSHWDPHTQYHPCFRRKNISETVFQFRENSVHLQRLSGMAIGIARTPQARDRSANTPPPRYPSFQRLKHADALGGLFVVVAAQPSASPREPIDPFSWKDGCFIIGRLFFPAVARSLGFLSPEKIFPKKTLDMYWNFPYLCTVKPKENNQHLKTTKSWKHKQTTKTTATSS